MAIVVFGAFEWDSEKADANVAKHGVTFEEAATALDDANAVYIDAGDGDTTEERIAAIGMSAKPRLLLVVHVERGARDRIVSARLATVGEEKLYEEG